MLAHTSHTVCSLKLYIVTDIHGVVFLPEKGAAITVYMCCIGCHKVTKKKAWEALNYVPKKKNH